jgi:hypothetical protein
LGVNLGRAVLYLVGDDSALGKTLKGVGSALKTGLAVGIGAVVAGTGLLIAGLFDATKAAMEAELVQADLNAVLKSTGGIAGVTADAANELANSLSKVTMFEDDVILAGENMLLTFTNIGKDVFPMATQAMLDMAQKMGTDPTQAAIQLGKALNDPIAGISALSRVGVTFSEDQKKTIKALMDTGDTAGAQKIILAELNKEFGGVAQAAGGTLQGQLTILQNQFGNVKESVGSALIPVISDLAKEYGPQLISFAKDGAKWLSENLVPAIKTVADWLKIYLPPAIQFVTDVWNIVLKPALEWLWAFLLDTLIPALVIFVAWFRENLPVAIKFLTDLWDQVLKPALEWLWTFLNDTLIPSFLVLAAWFEEYLPVAIQFLTDVWNNVYRPVLEWLWNFLNDTLIPTFVILAAWFKEHLPDAIKWAREAWEKINKAIQDTATFIQKAIDKFNEIKAFLAGIRLPNPFQPLLDAIAAIGNFRLPSWAGSALNLPGYATGTAYFPGGMTLVGEQGPEVVALPRGSRIWPNGEGPGGGNVSIVINAPGGDPYAVRGAVLSGLEAAHNRGWR